MARNKYKYISISRDKRSVRIRIRTDSVSYSKNFSVKDYGSLSAAKQAAVNDRDDFLMNARANKGYNSSLKRTFGEVFYEMKALYPKRVTTFEKYDKLYRKYMQSIRNMDISEITAADIMERVLNQMISCATDRTIADVVTILRLCFKTAKVKKYTWTNPMDEISIPKSEIRPKHLNATVSVETLGKVIDALERDSKYQTKATKFNRKMIAGGIWVQFYCGMRPAEAFALQRSDLDFKRKTIHISSELGSSYSQHNVVRPPKTEKSDRIVPMPDKLIPHLKSALSMHDSVYVFPAYGTDTHLELHKIQQVVNCLCKKEGIDFHMYALRHQLATDLFLNNSTDPRTIMELLGHTQLTTSVGYARSNSEAKARALNDRKVCCNDDDDD